MTMVSNYLFAECDRCNCDLNEENGCHSYWHNNNIITVCDKCSMWILSDR
jgi:hypothetical protein